MSNTINEASIRKLKLLVTVVDRQKSEFYLDVLSQYEINLQMVVSGMGTASSELIELLDLNPHKAVILSVAREDRVEEIVRCLDEKFRTIKNGNGIAFAVSLSSVIGVNLYRFMSNNRKQ